MSSRSLDDLLPVVKVKALRHVQLCKDAGIDLLIYCTFRSQQEQDELYTQGRTTVGAIVTNARGGNSFHNWRLAYDCVPLRYGKAVWGTVGHDGVLWREVGRLGKFAGLEWAGDWPSFKEFPHFQYSGGIDLAAIKRGSVPT